MRVHGPLAIMVLSYLLPAACAGCTTAFLSGSSQDVPEKSLQSRRAKQEGLERSESSKYLLTIPYPVCILRIVNNVHVEVIG